MDVQTYIQNFSPFYRTSSPVRAATQKLFYMRIVLWESHIPAEYRDLRGILGCLRAALGALCL